MTSSNEERHKRGTTVIPIILTGFFLLGAWNVSCAFAEEARICAEELARFCKDVRPGGGRIIACLKNHESELSTACRDKLQSVQKKLEEAKQTCANDIEKFCKGVEPGEGRIAKCLEKHTDDLSPTCAEKLEWVKTRMTGK
jgi:hypothetical protein